MNETMKKQASAYGFQPEAPNGDPQAIIVVYILANLLRQVSTLAAKSWDIPGQIHG